MLEDEILNDRLAHRIDMLNADRQEHTVIFKSLDPNLTTVECETLWLFKQIALLEPPKVPTIIYQVRGDAVHRFY